MKSVVHISKGDLKYLKSRIFQTVVIIFICRYFCYCYPHSYYCKVLPSHRTNILQHREIFNPESNRGLLWFYLTWSLAFSRALGCLLVLTLSYHWLLVILSFALIGSFEFIGFCVTTLNRNAFHTSKLVAQCL